jgi:protein-S-isoprenylcysteine O-methyltransferase Ste14
MGWSIRFAPTSTTLGLSISADQDRGDRWVVVQFVLMVLLVVAAFLPPGWRGLTTVLAPIGVAVGFLGLLLTVWAWRTLGSAATAFPRPREGGRLVETGPYALVRHPVYAGGFLFFLGLALATSPAALLPLTALTVLWRNKAALEDEWLAERYEDYGEYRRRVPASFVPRSFHVDRVA